MGEVKHIAAYVAGPLLLWVVFLVILLAGRPVGQECKGWEAPARIDGQLVCLDLEEDLGLID